MEGDMDSPVESNNLGFEHVDSPPVSSTTGDPAEFGDADLYNASEPPKEPDTMDLLNFESAPAAEKPAEKPAAPSAPAIDSFFEPDSSLVGAKEETKPSQPEQESKPSSGCIFSSGGGECCAWLKNIDPRVLDLIYWRDVKRTGVVFGSAVVSLLALAVFSVVSVLAYLGLAVLAVTLSFRVYKNVIGAVQKSGDGHPFRQYLEMDVALPAERVHHVADLVMDHAKATTVALRRLFLVEDLVDSLKFALLLWVFTYIGAWFNGLTLIILATVTIFSAPKIYQTHKTQIDAHLELAVGHVKKVIEQVQSKIPLPGKKKQQ